MLPKPGLVLVAVVVVVSAVAPRAERDRPPPPTRAEARRAAPRQRPSSSHGRIAASDRRETRPAVRPKLVPRLPRKNTAVARASRLKEGEGPLAGPGNLLGNLRAVLVWSTTPAPVAGRRPSGDRGVPPDPPDATSARRRKRSTRPASRPTMTAVTGSKASPSPGSPNVAAVPTRDLQARPHGGWAL